MYKRNIANQIQYVVTTPWFHNAAINAWIFRFAKWNEARYENTKDGIRVSVPTGRTVRCEGRKVQRITVK